MLVIVRNLDPTEPVQKQSCGVSRERQVIERVPVRMKQESMRPLLPSHAQPHENAHTQEMLPSLVRPLRVLPSHSRIPLEGGHLRSIPFDPVLQLESQERRGPAIDYAMRSQLEETHARAARVRHPVVPLQAHRIQNLRLKSLSAPMHPPWIVQDMEARSTPA